MRIGVVSDTHNNLKNVARIVTLLNEARVDRVVHTGDITQAKTLDILARLDAPVFGVFGNNDEERSTLESAIARHGFSFCDPPLTLSWSGRRIVVVHDPLEFDGVIDDGHELALHGHTHLYRLENRPTPTGRQLIFNPGECAGHLRGHNAVGVVDLVDLSVNLIRF